MERIVSASVTPTVTSGSAYATGQSIGGLLTFGDIASRGYSSLYSAILTDASGQNAQCDLILFDSNPSGSTVTDKQAVAIAAADLPKVLGVISFASTDYASLGTPSAAGKGGKVGFFMGLIGRTDNNVYGALISRGTPTYTSTSAITVRLTAELGIL